MSYPQYSTGMTGHPEMAEMRERLERTASTGKAIALEGLILLTGLYAAISPWAVHFAGLRNITANNLIVGITIGLIGLGLALVPERMFRLAWALVPLGIWLLISPWVVTASHSARAGVIWNNVLIGVVTMALGLAAMGLTIGVARPDKR
ncbi:MULTISPECIES: SPW repeat protein [Streptomyces]|uniref:SPW repeat protein n=1 Tax=Streptomyces eurythermus TaxID=42237 RepID=A0ABW6YSU7_9ACTN|nr:MULTISPECIES: SPW repeat protein [Streptomyces]QIS69064.1 SPW repeat protein [Streptomyces sp. DSM 40868]WDM11049.1 SPW repeat protein [Streptomyces lavenduligriseus]